MILRGDIYNVDLSPVVGSEQGGRRPVLVVQNNMGNRFGPTVIIAPITSASKNNLPTHVKLEPCQSGLTKESIVLLEQLRTVDKSRLGAKLGSLNEHCMDKINSALIISLGLDLSKEVNKCA